MDQEIVNEMRDLDTQINNLNLSPVVKTDELKDLQDLRSAVDTKIRHFKEAEQRRVEEFKSDIRQAMNSIKARIERLQS